MFDHTPPSTNQPNFLFLFPDQWRWDWLGCHDGSDTPYGDIPVNTPNIDALAARGVQFTQCRTNSPLCAPARACLAQGVRYDRCSVIDNGQDTPADALTFFQLLRNAGYRTTTCGKNDLHKKTIWKGRDGWTQLLGQYGFTDAIDHSGKYDCANGGRVEKGGPHCSYASHLHAHGLFHVYQQDYARRADEASGVTATWPTPLPTEHYTDVVCGKAGLELLDRMPNEGPWMLWVNFPGPHDPFDPPREYQQHYDGVAMPEPINAEARKRDKPADHQQIRRNYAAQCELLDEWVGRLIDKVAQRGELDNTVIVFASDHGEMLGDHGRFTKAVPHEGSMHVPLIAAGPGIAQDKTSDELVELIDLAATFVDLADLDVPESFDACSIAPLLRDPNGGHQHRDVQVSGLRSWRSVFDGRYKLVLTSSMRDGRARMVDSLFDLETDAGEQVNVIEDQPEIANRLRKTLESEIGAWPAN